MEYITIGVAGGSASGKSTLTKQIVENTGTYVAILHHDNYYKSRDSLSEAERKVINYDHPDAFDTEFLIEQLIALKNGNSILSPVYDFVQHTRKKIGVVIEPSRIIIVEGILILENKKLRDLIDIKIFVDTDAEERALRRMVRDFNERGRTINSIAMQYLTTVKPMYELYVDPTMKYADIIINGSRTNSTAINMIVNAVRSFLNVEEKSNE